MLTRFGTTRAGLRMMCVLLPTLMMSGFTPVLRAQAPAAPAAARQLGTVKSIDGSTVTLTTDDGKPATITLGETVRVVQLAPGSTDLKTATAAAVSDIGVGDRVLATGKAGEAAGALTASRVILMKSTDIAQKRAQQQADWQKRGSGGIVNAVDAATGTLTVTEGAKKIQVKTTGTTIFRRYSGDSVKFEDAIAGTLAQVQPGDQFRVRGDKSEDGTSIQAEEIVSGSFKNLAGTIATINAADSTITLKDLSTKKMMTVKVTANSDVRALPERAAMMFAARAKGGAAPAGAGAGRPEGAGGAGRPEGGGPGGPGAGGPGGRSAGMDLSQMISRLPTQSLADLKVGEAVMIVASQATPSSPSVTAVTLLTGVEPILAASPSGTPMSISPWSVGGGAPETGGAQ